MTKRFAFDSGLDAAAVVRGTTRRCIGYSAEGQPMYGPDEDLGILSISFNPTSPHQWWRVITNVWRHGWRRSR